MIDKLEEIKKKFSSDLLKAKNLETLEKVKVHFLGKKGSVTLLLKGMAELDPSKRKEFGQNVNQLKSFVEEKIDAHRVLLEDKETEKKLKSERIDVTLPGKSQSLGSLHPITRVQALILDIFKSMGFTAVDGPEVETDYYNFESLNFPLDHPARDMQDTFFVEKNHLLRTHTSPVQVRTMEVTPPPLRIVAPGRVYRCDMDATHSPVFHQIEGLCVGPDINFTHFKGTMELFISKVFGEKTKVRFRPSFFPFTEPSAEVDIWGKHGWMEIMGCGMVDPNVFENIGKPWIEKTGKNPYDPEKISGFAFGMGIERIAMLLYEVSDIRLFYENDIRFLRQFR